MTLNIDAADVVARLQRHDGLILEIKMNNGEDTITIDCGGFELVDKGCTVWTARRKEEDKEVWGVV